MTKIIFTLCLVFLVGCGYHVGYISEFSHFSPYKDHKGVYHIDEYYAEVTIGYRAVWKRISKHTYETSRRGDDFTVWSDKNDEIPDIDSLLDTDGKWYKISSTIRNQP